MYLQSCANKLKISSNVGTNGLRNIEKQEILIFSFGDGHVGTWYCGLLECSLWSSTSDFSGFLSGLPHP